MSRSSKGTLWAIFLLLGMGTLLVVVNFIPILFITMGTTLIFMGLCLLFLECGPRVCYWWVAIRIGCDVKMPHKEYMANADEIEEWLKDNIIMGFTYTNKGNIYYFLRNTDAAGFKLRWI